MAKKFTLVPIEKRLIQIRDGLKKEIAKATPAQKKVLAAEIKKLNKLIKEVPAACDGYDVGG